MLLHVFTTIFMILLVMRIILHIRDLVRLNMTKDVEIEQTVKHVIQLFLLSTPPFWGIYWINVLSSESSCFTEAGTTILITFIAAISMVFAVFLNDYQIRWW